MSVGQSFNQRVTRPLIVMLLTVGLLFGGGLILTKLRTSPPAKNTSDNQPTASAVPTAQPAVNVFNATPTAGLARQVSEVLVTRGWEISQIGNWSGPALKESTIFYPVGFAKAANDLAGETSAVVKPALANMGQTSLTLVLMK